MTSWPRIFDSAAWDHTGTIRDVFHNTLLPILAAGPPLWRLGVTPESGKIVCGFLEASGSYGNTASMSSAVTIWGSARTTRAATTLVFLHLNHTLADRKDGSISNSGRKRGPGDEQNRILVRLGYSQGVSWVEQITWSYPQVWHAFCLCSHSA